MAATWDEALYRDKVIRCQALVGEVERLHQEIDRLEKSRVLPPEDPHRGINSLPDDLLMLLFTNHLSDQYQLEDVCVRWRFIMEATETMRFKARWSIPRRCPQYQVLGSSNLPGGFQIEQAPMWAGGSALPRKSISGDMMFCVQGLRVYACVCKTHATIMVFKNRTRRWTRTFSGERRISVNVDEGGEGGGHILVRSLEMLVVVSVRSGLNVNCEWVPCLTAVYDGLIYRAEGGVVIMDRGPYKYTKTYGPLPKRSGRIMAIVVVKNYIWTIGGFGVAMYDRHTCNLIQYLTYHSYGMVRLAAYHQGKLYISKSDGVLHIY